MINFMTLSEVLLKEGDNNMLDDKSPLSLQYQLYSTLFEKISNGSWAEGYQIPSERELCNEYSVSRMTVREAVKSLVQEGYLIRKQGKGTFVSVPKFEQQLTSYFSLSQEIERRGLQSEFKILEFKKSKPNFAVKEALRLSDTDKVYELIRLRLIGNETFAWEKSIIPEVYLKEASEEEIMENGLYPTISKYSAMSPVEAEEEVTAINCPNDIADALKLEKNAAVLHITRLTKAKEHYIEYCESYIHGEKYKYKHMIKRR